MIIFKRTNDLTNWLKKETESGKTIGFVPTMGALHAGHISLITISKKAADLTVCSIFVNPTQFNDPKDFQKYPVTLEKDIALLEGAGADILYLPTVSELYPDGTARLERYELGSLETLLEGKYRPGHFQGVCQVMSRLLSIVQPDHLFMGQKDYQQCMVIKWLINYMKLKTVFHACPTVREHDGLAMSSRNLRLNEEQRKKAVAIFESLNYIKRNLNPGNLSDLLEKARTNLKSKGFKIDYLDIANADNLEKVSVWNGKQKLVALAAAFLDEIRLIDNMLLNE